MTKTLIILATLFIAFNGLAQETETSEADKKKMDMTRMIALMGQKIEMNVDLSLFKEVSTNSYVSDSPKAVIMAMMIPDSYESSKEKMDNDAGDKFKVTDKGEKEINGITVLYMEGVSETDGITLNNEIYCMAIDDETCLMFVGMFDKDASANYSAAITEARNSVIKKK